ncbi:calcium-binding protein, partial [Campylobacter ureolyticus]|uniref:calcium-binding protein n=1 Tax=Campylobacter ureolyticus TaxID=827 RepID=UPI0022CBFF83|nr:hypothetical protein [Campylobacter ureolyticus]MCZ6158852.1 hypothetical protein [Campylobacter ureolyticus]
DRLEGYGSNDTYIFNRGDEKDTIYDTGGNDTLKFGEGISREDLIIKRDKNDIKIYVKDSPSQNIDDITDIVTIKDWYNSSNKIENIILNDGTKIDYSFLFNPTEGDDNLTFGDEDNIINALGGNDIIYAGGGNDIIDGGSGNDILYG